MKQPSDLELAAIKWWIEGFTEDLQIALQTAIQLYLQRHPAIKRKMLKQLLQAGKKAK